MDDGTLLAHTEDMYWGVRRLLCAERIQVDWEEIHTPVGHGAPVELSLSMDLVRQPNKDGGPAKWEGAASYSGKMVGSYLKPGSSSTTVTFNSSIGGPITGSGSGFIFSTGKDAVAQLVIAPSQPVDKFVGEVDYGHKTEPTGSTPTPILLLDLLDLDLTALPDQGPYELRGQLRREDDEWIIHHSWSMTVTLVPAIRHIDIWMNAFIPLDAPGLTVPRPNHPGQTMIPGVPFGNYYLTDQRSWSDDPFASSRMHQRLRFDLAASEVRTWRRCDVTVGVDKKSGEALEEASASVDRLTMELLTSTANLPGPAGGPVEPSRVEVELDGAANNPLVALTKIAGDIDWEGTWTILVDFDLQEATVQFNGLIDEYPDFEAYASVSKGADATVVYKVPGVEGGTPPKNLPGNANRPVTASATLTPPGQ